MVVVCYSYVFSVECHSLVGIKPNNHPLPVSVELALSHASLSASWPLRNLYPCFKNLTYVITILNTNHGLLTSFNKNFECNLKVEDFSGYRYAGAIS